MHKRRSVPEPVLQGGHPIGWGDEWGLVKPENLGLRVSNEGTKGREDIIGGGRVGIWGRLGRNRGHGRGKAEQRKRTSELTSAQAGLELKCSLFVTSSNGKGSSISTVQPFALLEVFLLLSSFLSISNRHSHTRPSRSKRDHLLDQSRIRKEQTYN